MTKKSTGYKFNHGDIVTYGVCANFGKIKSVHPECPHDNEWLQMQAIKAENVRVPWYGLLLLDGGSTFYCENDLYLMTATEVFDWCRKHDDSSSDSDCDYVSDTSEGDGSDSESSESESDSESESSESESDSESENVTTNNNNNDNKNKCEYIIKLMLTTAELSVIGETKPVVSFTMNNKSTSLTTNGNPYDYPLVYMYPMK